MIWFFSNRGKWATHDAKYLGDWSPYISRNIILRYSKEGYVVLDQFAGSGTTLVEAKLLGRTGIGVDINRSAIDIATQHLDFTCDGCGKTELHIGNARKLDFLKDESIDLIATHPPYANIIQYSEDTPDDLSLLKIPEFLQEMNTVATECFRILRKGKFCAILIGDKRQNGHVISLGFQVMVIFMGVGFVLKEIIIKEQHNCKMKYNFLLLAHEYLFVFHK